LPILTDGEADDLHIPIGKIAVLSAAGAAFDDEFCIAAAGNCSRCYSVTQYSGVETMSEVAADLVVSADARAMIEKNRYSTCVMTFDCLIK
jgi:hypothetical protein